MFKKIINAISVIFLVFLVIFVLFTLVSRIMGETPSVFGNYIFRVSSDSMEPTLMVGDVILVQSADAEDIQKGDIITYKSKDGSMYGREVTHRVVADPVIKHDTYYYQTQGDAVGAPLDKAITYDQVKGKYVRKLTLIGKLYGFMSKPIGVAIFIGVIVLLFGYEVISMIVSYRKIDEVDLDAIAEKKLSDKKNQK
nr:signal peptidase I [uncultured Ruminococcus sp.]